MIKQENLFNKEDKNNKYSLKIEAPVYEPKNQNPHILLYAINLKQIDL